VPLLINHPENNPGQTDSFSQITESYELATLFILPATSALIYELSSWGQSNRWFQSHGVQVSLLPIVNRGNPRLQSSLGFVF
jgi:hypothetical protein